MAESVTPEWSIGGELLEPRADRTLWWPSRRTLIAADVHLGKGAALRRFGIPLPDACEVDLQRLSRAITATGALRLLILGDLVHSRTGFEAALAAWDPGIERVLIAGNHDRGAVPTGFTVVPELDEGGLRFRHAPEPIPGTVCGHLHPKIRLSRGPDAATAVCFWQQGQTLVLPAFGSHTGGQTITAGAGDRLGVLGATGIIDIVVGGKRSIGNDR